MDTPRITIVNGLLIDAAGTRPGDLHLVGGRIARVGGDLTHLPAERTIDAAGSWVLPGLIDPHVHFREPGDPTRGDLVSESAAAVAGGVTAVLEMPNTTPPTVDARSLADKQVRAAHRCRCHHGFFLGATAGNLEVVRAIDPTSVPGVKVYLGSSTGDLLLDEDGPLDALFRDCPVPIAAHCEDDARIRQTAIQVRGQYGETPPAGIHAVVRDRQACLASTQRAVDLARRHRARLHLCHLTTAEEVALLADLADARITAEACLAHLWFSTEDYVPLGNRLKCNPAVKTAADRQALQQALRQGTISVIGTDHAPHPRSAKTGTYFTCASGLPLVQYLLPALMDLVAVGILPREVAVARSTADVARCYGIVDRGNLYEGWHADVVIADPEASTRASDQAVLSRVGWTPFHGTTFNGAVRTTIIGGRVAYEGGRFAQGVAGQPLEFLRDRR